jgi:hypothetical protein
MDTAQLFFHLTHDLKRSTFHPVRTIQTLDIMYVDSHSASYLIPLKAPVVLRSHSLISFLALPPPPPTALLDPVTDTPHYAYR